MDYSRKIINKLLDKFESSKSFNSTNKVNQSFYIVLIKQYPEYGDDGNYKAFEEINRAVALLIEKKLVVSKLKKNNTYDKILLNISNINCSYTFANRTDKKGTYADLEKLLIEYSNKGNSLLNKFIVKQIENIEKNVRPKYFAGSLLDYADFLKCVYEIQKIENEISMREFSIRVFNDSKKFEIFADKVRNILFDYGEFASKDTVFEELNLLRNPSYIYLKGDGIIELDDYDFNVSHFSGGIGLTSFDVAKIRKVIVKASKVITIENLTSFYNFTDKEYFVIYLGGFHNTLRRNLLKLIYTNNSDKEYYHFGDIDAGGFYILEHLRHKTAINFNPIYMDINTLKKYNKFWKPLTDNDIRRLKCLKNPSYLDTILFMLKNNCKLEQEIVEQNDTSLCGIRK